MHDTTYRDQLGTKGITSLWLKHQSEAEAELANTIRRFFRRQAAATVDKLDTETDSSIAAKTPDELIADLFDPADWTEGFKEAVRPHLEGIARVGVLSELAMIHTKESGRLQGIPGRTQDAVMAFLAAMLAADYWYKIQDTTMGDLAGAITAAAATGLSVAVLSKLVRKSIAGKAAMDRAAKIASVESTSALNGGHQLGMEELRLRDTYVEKQWFTRMDGKVRPTHAALEGVTVGIDGFFDVGGELAPYPAFHGLSAKERINCRCGIRSVETVPSLFQSVFAE